MIPVDDIFHDVLDRINLHENGYMSNSQFNRFSWLGQLYLIDWISGDISNITPPQPYLTSKNKAYLSPFITKYPVHVVGGIVTKPSDYYLWEHGYILGNYSDINTECESDEEEAIEPNEGNTPIELLDGDKFNSRCHTYIEGLKPSLKKAIAKEIGNTFEFIPKDIGSITIEYIRYPVKSKRAVKMDTVYNEEVYDEANSTDFEWPEYARGILTLFIADLFSNFTREQALKQFNAATKKTVRA